MLLISSIDSLSFLNESLQQPVFDGVNSGFELATLTVTATFLLELCSIPTVRGVLQQKDGKSLYLTAILLNFVNHYIYAIPVYVVAILVFCRDEPANDYPTFLMRAAGILLIHSLTFYTVHKTFHTSPKLYIHHRFHHRFKKHVPPVSANAVSAVEYLAAYILPFALGALIVRPHISEMRTVINVTSLSNLLIHTPRLEKLSEKLWPVFVTTHGHIEHHKKLTMNYAAPTINVDCIVQQVKAASGKLA